ncbi:hypothetical protein CCP2SC5_420005 [Azospirillaceae bacterium]
MQRGCFPLPLSLSQQPKTQFLDPFSYNAPPSPSRQSESSKIANHLLSTGNATIIFNNKIVFYTISIIPPDDTTK